jgi:5-methylcytosine-specific restriction endonuclease McrA
MSKSWPSSQEELQACREKWASLSPADKQKILDKEAGIKPSKKVKFLIKKPKRVSRKLKLPYTNDEWQAARKDVFERDGKICYICFGVATQVDHVKPKSKYPELALDRNNLKPVCWPCNRLKSTKDPI